jgi:hypothetical protein
MCDKCNGRGYTVTRILEEKGNAKTVTKPCPTRGCNKGLFAVPHAKCQARGCEECSTVEQHGIKGRVLCKHCNGQGCDGCNHTGLYSVLCNFCMGTGEVHVTARQKVLKVITTPCLACVQQKAAQKVQEGSRHVNAFELALAEATHKGVPVEA